MNLAVAATDDLSIRAGGDGLLGLDLGTSSAKAVVTDLDGHVLSVASAGYPVTSPQPGWAETAPQLWWAAVVAASCEATGAAGRQIRAVGLSGQMHGVVLADSAGAPIRPAILHADVRALQELDRYRALQPEALDRLANPLSPNMAGPILLWLRKHEPRALVAARWALQPKDWLRWQLTGQVASEPSDASATLLFDIAGDTWDDAVIAELDLPADKIAPLLPSAGAQAGHLTSAAAAELGVRPGIPVAAGGADTAVAAIGTGLTTVGDTQLTIGTSGQIITPLADPRPLPGVHLYRTATPRGWYAMGAILNAGLALDWVRRILGTDWPELYATAGTPIDDDGPLFLPHLAGERTPYQDPTMRGAWTGLALHHTRTDLLRSALQGVAFGLREALDSLPPSPVPDHPIRLAGGGTVSPAWRQMLADILGRPLEAHTVPAASGRGAALLAGVAADMLTWKQLEQPDRGEPGQRTIPNEAAHDRYQPILERYIAAVGKLRDGAGPARA